jgi:hypothetical protein
VTRRRLLAGLAAAAGCLLGACGSSTTSVTETVDSQATTPAAATLTTPTQAELLAVVDRLLPIGQSGRASCFSGDATFRACPLTERLRLQVQHGLENAPPGGGADPICGCQNFDQNATFTAVPGTPPGGGTVRVVGFGGSYRIEYVIVAADGMLLTDNIVGCSGQSPTDAYGLPTHCS